MHTMLLALSLTILGRAPPRPVPGLAPQASSRPTDDEIYQVARAALIEARNRANTKDPSVRQRAAKNDREATLKALCKRFDIAMDRLLAIIAEGEEKDGTADKRRLANNPAKARAKQENAMILGVMGAQLDAQASAFADRARADQAASVNAQLNRQRRALETGTPASAFRYGPIPWGYGAGGDPGGYYVGPRQPPGHYAGGVGSSHKGGTYINPATNNHYQKSSN